MCTMTKSWKEMQTSSSKIGVEGPPDLEDIKNLLRVQRGDAKVQRDMMGGLRAFLEGSLALCMTTFQTPLSLPYDSN